MDERTFIGGVLREWRDDAARVVHRYDAQGAEILPATAYTPEQNIEADARVDAEAEQDAKDVQRVAVRAIVTDVKTEIDALNLVISATTGNTKQLAQSAKRIGAAVIDLAKLLKDY